MILTVDGHGCAVAASSYSNEQIKKRHLPNSRGLFLPKEIPVILWKQSEVLPTITGCCSRKELNLDQIGRPTNIEYTMQNFPGKYKLYSIAKY